MKRHHHLKPYIWNKAAECKSRDEMEALQSDLLVSAIARLYRLPVYKERFDNHGVHPSMFQSIVDIAKLPFTTKDDLRENYPFGLFATSIDKVVELHTSSGTTGKPTVVGYTRADIKLWSELTARVLATVGVKPGTIIQDAYGFGVTTGGQGFQYGAELIGATVLPASTGNDNRQLMFFEDLGAHVILCTPSYALTLAEIANERKLDLNKISLEAGVFGAEPWSEMSRKKIESSWGIRAYDTYGLSEIIGPGVAHECEVKNGLHIYEDHFFPEIINPQTLQPVSVGDVGELVITAITKEALPMVRYRTGDIAKLSYLPCECGRTLVRMSRVAGRSDDMLIVNGITLFPGQVEAFVLHFAELNDTFQILLDRREKSHECLEICVETKTVEQIPTIEKDQLCNRLAAAAKKSLGISTHWHILPNRTIPRSTGKANRVVFKEHGAIYQSNS